MSKVSIIGAGNVGATAAMKLAKMNIVDEIVLLDIKEGFAEGKAMDIMQCAVCEEFVTDVTGVTNDYSKTAGSDVIVITSGVPRKPGMTREELVGINSSIMKSVVEGCDKYSPDAVYVVVSNPMDTMTYQVLNILMDIHRSEQASQTFIPYSKRVIGMGGMLDSSRFRYFIYKALKEKGMTNININNITGYVVGAHSDKNMVPVKDSVLIIKNHVVLKIDDLFTKEEFDSIVDKTKRGGAILTGLLGTSAWEAPGTCIANLVSAIVTDKPDFLAPCSVYNKDVDAAIGMYIKTCKTGIKEIYMPAEVSDVDAFKESVDAVKQINEALPKLN